MPPPDVTFTAAIVKLADALVVAQSVVIAEFSGGDWDDELRAWAASEFDDDSVERGALVAAVERHLSSGAPASLIIVAYERESD